MEGASKKKIFSSFNKKCLEIQKNSGSFSGGGARPRGNPLRMYLLLVFKKVPIKSRTSVYEAKKRFTWLPT
jgi:hypothetical protein